jgi:pyruvate formate lyase activating enzyme
MRIYKDTNRREFIRNAFCGSCGLAMMAGGWPVSALSRLQDEETLREAMFYTTTPRHIKCRLCPHQCNITGGKTGDCRVRVNRGGKLFTLAWSNPCAIHVDPVEKKPLYHYLPGTQTYSLAIAGCNFTCLNCQNWEISQSDPGKTRNYFLPPWEAVKNAKSLNCQSISYTYSEPVTFFEYTLETARLSRQAGIRNIVVSNGYIHEAPLEEWCKYIDAANIDLKAFDDDIYAMLNNGTLQPVLNTLLKLKEKGIWLEITNLIIPQWTDDIPVIDKMCRWLASNGFRDTPLHFSRFHPQYKLNRLPQTPLPLLEKAKTIATGHGLQYVYIGNVPGYNQANTICPQCKQVAVERSGFTVRKMLIKAGRCGNCGSQLAGVWA